MCFELSQYLLDQWGKRHKLVEEPNEPEKLIVSCAFQEILRKLLLEAKLKATRSGFSEVKPSDVEAALEDFLDT